MEVRFHNVLKGEKKFMLIFSFSSEDRDNLMRRIPIRRDYSSLLIENRKRVLVDLENHTKTVSLGNDHRWKMGMKRI